jgi:phosphatidylserine/phosphatidylglycerophosphate/cardiolipin synthase-like enzyme
MPAVDELKNKWFLDVGIEDRFPPQTRHPGTQVQPSTDGNKVEALIDGAEVMKAVHARIQAMLTDPINCEFWLPSWRLDPVRMLGQSRPGTDAEAVILNAAAQGVKVHYLGSGHVGRNSDAQAFANQLLAKSKHGFNATSDKRFPRWGSQHQKFYVFRGPGTNEWSAIVGSVDLSFPRWDTNDHNDKNDERPSNGGPTHDVAVSVVGPAVHDIVLTFAERWNDPAHRERTSPPIPATAKIATDGLGTPIPSPPHGTHSVQVLRTYGITRGRGYSWSSTGEFTVWAAYLQAIRGASSLIYIEDQYFYTFGDPPGIDPSVMQDSDLQVSDIVFQLGQALERGVDVVVLVPSRSADNFATYQLHQRAKAARYLQDISEADGGLFVICSLKVGDQDPIVHSKLMIVDDELVHVGTANVGQRSMTHDAEIHLAIVDAANAFARDLRLAMWKEHMELGDVAAIDTGDLHAAVLAFRDNAVAANNRLRIAQLDPVTTQPRPFYHGLIMNQVIDPYGGPNRSR